MLTLASAASLLSPQHLPAEEGLLRWRKLPAIPDPEGFAGSFGGVSNGALLVAGGANIVGEKWGPAFEKKWYDHVFVLDGPELRGNWKLAGHLPRPSGYGVSASTETGLVCAGGSDAENHHREVFLLHWEGGRLSITPLPSLPRPCANMAGTRVGEFLYVAGGLESPSSTQSLRTFWRLNLQKPEEGWSELEPWPGPGRMLSVAGSDGRAFYLFGGAQLTDGNPERIYLRDAYRYTPETGWTRLPDMPFPLAAAPSPALFVNGVFVIPSGDDGSKQGFSPVEKHPGFRRNSLVYDPAQNRWTEGESIPFSLATASVIPWHGSYILPGGEARPRVRTPDVWMAEPNRQ